jgi:hypothetical protein
MAGGDAFFDLQAQMYGTSQPEHQCSYERNFVVNKRLETLQVCGRLLTGRMR